MIQNEKTAAPLRTWLIVPMLTTLLAHGLVAQDSPEIPEWFVQHIEFMTRAGGYWVADNERYQSDNEPFDSYLLIWEKGIGDLSLKGRMFALENGQKVAELWQFRTVWDPAQRRVLALQFGRGGVYGSGVMVSIGQGRHRLDQTFHAPDGGSFRSGHEAREDGDRHHTHSFDIDPDGSWKQGRSYIWTRKGAD